MVAQLVGSITTLQNALLDLLFPPRCITCRSSGDSFCASCRTSIENIPPPFCGRCGRPRPAHSSPFQSECPHCDRHPLQINGTRAVAFFEGNLRTAIHAFKYQHRTELAEPLGELMSEFLAVHPLPTDAIIAVPLHPGRERERGYNQALLLARIVSEHQRRPLWEKALVRTRATPSQVELDAVARRENVKDAFAATDQVAGVRVLLVDDVCTTGATMEACGMALLARGASSVWGLALARPRLD
jgi:ComF family protein